MSQIFAVAQTHSLFQTDAEPHEIAEDLLGLIEGLGMIRAQLGVSGKPYPDIDRRIARVVATILKMHCS